jgi:hypothetical protein
MWTCIDSYYAPSAIVHIRGRLTLGPREYPPGGVHGDLRTPVRLREAVGRETLGHKGAMDGRGKERELSEQTEKAKCKASEMRR